MSCVARNRAGRRNPENLVELERLGHDLMGGTSIDMPPLHEVSATFKKAAKAESEAPEQGELLLHRDPEDEGISSTEG